MILALYQTALLVWCNDTTSGTDGHSSSARLPSTTWSAGYQPLFIIYIYTNIYIYIYIIYIIYIYIIYILYIYIYYILYIYILYIILSLITVDGCEILHQLIGGKHPKFIPLYIGFQPWSKLVHLVDPWLSFSTTDGKRAILPSLLRVFRITSSLRYLIYCFQSYTTICYPQSFVISLVLVNPTTVLRPFAKEPNGWMNIWYYILYFVLYFFVIWYSYKRHINTKNPAISRTNTSLVF